MRISLFLTLFGHLLGAQPDGRVATPVPSFKLNMDLPQEDRWTDIASQYKDKVGALIAYFDTFVPKWARPIVSTIGKDIEPYFATYGQEMQGLSKALGLDLGYLVTLNLVYQLEYLGLNCSNWNNTGPTIPNDPGCMAVDPQQTWCYCHNKTGFLQPPRVERGESGMCTSIVAQDASGRIFHGRNLDWNLEEILRELIIDVDFQTNGTTLFKATTIVGFVGVINGLRPSQYTVTVDARGKGGKVFDNLLEALLHGAMSPSQHLRKVFESSPNYDSAIQALQSGDLIDEIYYIAAGTSAGQGAVLSRDRNDAGDLWGLNATDASGWYRLQTNYDHWNPVPKADDRRTPGIEHMNKLGQGGVGVPGLYSVITEWPTYNSHTDYSCVLAAFNNTYESWYWKDPAV